jgi:hypothetical protein
VTTADADQDVRAAVHRRLLATEGAEALVAATPDELRGRIAALVALERPLLGAHERDRLVAGVLDDVVGLGALEPLLLDPTVDEIMVNGPHRCYVERDGALEAVPLHLDEAGILRLVERILAPLALRIDRASPMVDARLADGSRLHAVIPPLAIDGPCLTIRRFGARRLGLDDFGVDAAVATYREDLRRYRIRQDHAAQHPRRRARSGRPDRDDRGDRGAPAPATSRRAARGTARQRRGGRCRGSAGSRARGAADATGPARRR